MSKWLDTLRTKPVAVRRQYSYIGSFLITGAIVAVWFSTQTVTLLEPADVVNEEQQKGAFGRFFSNIKDQTAATFSAFGDSAEENESSQEETPEKATTSQVVLPEITNETRAETKAKQASSTEGTVLIATSSAETAE